MVLENTTGSNQLNFSLDNSFERYLKDSVITLEMFVFLSKIFFGQALEWFRNLH